MFKVKAHDRQSPVAHKVKSHIREGNRVHSYIRGHGKPIKKEPFKPTGKPQTRKNWDSDYPSVKAWHITFTYENVEKNAFGESTFDSEEFDVLATNSESAVDHADTLRQYPHRYVYGTDIKDPLLGNVMTAIHKKYGESKSEGHIKFGHLSVDAGKELLKKSRENIDKAKKSDLAQKFHGHLKVSAGKSMAKHGGFLGKIIGEHVGSKGADVLEGFNEKKAQKYLSQALFQQLYLRTPGFPEKKLLLI